MSRLALSYNFFMEEFLKSLIKAVVSFVIAGVVSLAGFFGGKVAINPVVGVDNKTELPLVGQLPSSSVNAFLEKETTTPKITAKTETIPKKENTSASTLTPFVPQIVVPQIVFQPQEKSLPPQITIDPQAIAGILCYYSVSVFDSSTGNTVSAGQELIRGSGVIVNSKGYVLTNRHIIQRPDSVEIVSNADGTQTEIKTTYKLDHCEVGNPPAGTYLPTPQEIQTINPLLRIPVLGYVAEPAYISSGIGLSDDENFFADFAVLKITGITKDGPSFGVTSLPTSFPYAKLLAIAGYDLVGQGVVTYGFPGDITVAQKESFQTLTMSGSVGNVTEIEYGDLYYRDTPLVIDAKLEIYGGRSGSPLFWRGYVIGLTTFYTKENRTESGSVASDAIIKALKFTGYLE